MRELSLFSGAGGGVLGTKLLGWECTGYVEFNDYCQRVIAQRIADGILDPSPIFGDIRAFISEGYAESYQGMVDVITAGFPCQPFSVAGKREGENDDRNMWPETIAAIRIIRPRFALFENVPGLLAHKYGRTIFRDLAESGYECRWRVLSAAEMGAPHKRDRLWIVAHTRSIGRGQKQVSELRCGNSPQLGNDGQEEHVAHAVRGGRKGPGQRGPLCPGEQCGAPNVAHPEISPQRPGLCPDEPPKQRRGRSGDGSDQAEHPHTRIQRLPQREGIQPWGQETNAPASPFEWWAVEPGLGRVADGVANRVDRLKALGNGQVPAVVRAAWEILNGL